MIYKLIALKLSIALICECVKFEERFRTIQLSVFWASSHRDREHNSLLQRRDLKQKIEIMGN